MQEATGSTVTDTGLEQPATLNAAQAKQWRPASSRPTRAVCINRPEAPTSLFRRFLKAKSAGISLDWFKGKSTGNHGFYHQI